MKFIVNVWVFAFMRLQRSSIFTLLFVLYIRFHIECEFQKFHTFLSQAQMPLFFFITLYT